MIAGTKDTTLSEQAKYKEPKVLEVGFFLVYCYYYMVIYPLHLIGN
jgi:hypothetical protein